MVPDISIMEHWNNGKAPRCTMVLSQKVHLLTKTDVLTEQGANHVVKIALALFLAPQTMSYATGNL